jgi:drug/metabolite transporter (DMT)-like permease
MIVIAVGFFTAGDAIAKALASRYPITLLVWVRYGVQAIATVIWLGPTMRTQLVRTTQLKLQVIRAVVLIASSFCFVGALKWLPLADATAINYCTPVLVVMLSVFALKERMTIARWGFVSAGFTGMLLIVRPGASILHGGALLAFACACFYAVYQLLTRKLRGDDVRVTLFYPALCGTLILTAIAPWLVPDAAMSWPDIGLTCVYGAAATVGHFLFIRAFQRAPASGLTPFTYVQLVWAMLAGWVFFAQFPDALSLIGIGIIAGSGLLLAWHEQRRSALSSVSEPTTVD